jgi:hypothetical protein
MSEIDPVLIKESEDLGMKMRKLADGSVAWRGPHLKDKWFDNYTEALHRNIQEKNRQEQVKLGLNEHWQTPEQAKAFKDRQKLAADNKKKAAIALQAVELTK